MPIIFLISRGKYSMPIHGIYKNKDIITLLVILYIQSNAHSETNNSIKANELYNLAASMNQQVAIQSQNKDDYSIQQSNIYCNCVLSCHLFTITITTVVVVKFLNQLSSMWIARFEQCFGS